MASIRTILFILALFVPVLAGAQEPKAGSYPHYMDDGKAKGGLLLVLTKTKQPKNLAASIAVKGATVTGTYYGATGQLKMMLRATRKDASGKTETAEVPVDGYWNEDRQSFYLSKAWFTLERSDFFASPHLAKSFDALIAKREREKLLTFTGTWNTGFGKMTLTQSGTSVTGSYDYYSGEIRGDIRADGNLYFKWTQKNPDKQGTGFFKLSADGKSFSGSWDYTLSNGEAANSGGGWSGTRIGPG